MSQENVEHAWSPCPKCKKINESTIFIEKNQVKIKINCLEHKEQESILFEDADFFKKNQNTIEGNKKFFSFNYDAKKSDKQMLTVDNPEKVISTIHINLTDKCNLKCMDCFAVCDPENNISVKEITKEEILKGLEIFENNKKKPMVVIIGGEPTLRSDLPDIIELLHQKGYLVRLSTNGILLKNREYMQRLVDKGLNWLLLQFDGFKNTTSIKFRGKDLIDVKAETLRNAQKLKLNVHLIMMISKGTNDDEILKSIKYAFEQPSVYAINFYPASLTGRYENISTSPLDCMKSMENQSNGTITAEDYFECKKLWTRLYKITKKPIFRQKLCTFPLFFYKMKDNIYPINRLFKFKNIIRHPVFSLRYFIKCFSLLRWDKKPNKSFIYSNIEKFYHSDALDLKEAYDCHNLFLTPNGYIPLCIYNAVFREKFCC